MNSSLGSMGVALDILMVLGLVLAMSLSSRLLGPRPAHEGDAEMPYETGVVPFGLALKHMSVLYWRFAVLFVVFDVDLAFLLPWALSGQAPGARALLAITGFVAVLALMLGYFWRKGALECR